MSDIELVKNNGKSYLKFAESGYIKSLGRQKKIRALDDADYTKSANKDGQTAFKYKSQVNSRRRFL